MDDYTTTAALLYRYRPPLPFEEIVQRFKRVIEREEPSRPKTLDFTGGQIAFFDIDLMRLGVASIMAEGGKAPWVLLVGVSEAPHAPAGALRRETRDLVLGNVLRQVRLVAPYDADFRREMPRRLDATAFAGVVADFETLGALSARVRPAMPLPPAEHGRLFGRYKGVVDRKKPVLARVGPAAEKQKHWPQPRPANGADDAGPAMAEIEANLRAAFNQ